MHWNTFLGYYPKNYNHNLFASIDKTYQEKFLLTKEINVLTRITQKISEKQMIDEEINLR